MAAPILAYEDLGVIQGHGWLFRHLDIHIGARDRLALIGRNGAGKTTLLKLIAGSIDCDEGRRVIVPGTRVVLLEQEPSLAGCATLAMGGFMRSSAWKFDRAPACLPDVAGLQSAGFAQETAAVQARAQGGS